MKYSGPIPDPQWLEHYELVHTGLADRIVSMAESEASHRREIERDAVAAQINDAEQDRAQQQRGQWMAFGVAIAVTGCGTAVALYGNPWPGSFLGGLGVTGLVAAFLGQKRVNGKVEAESASPQQEPDTENQ